MAERIISPQRYPLGFLIKSNMDVKLSELKQNSSNPRKITDFYLSKLIESILSFPEMLKLRPIVVRNQTIIGGNQRYRALIKISSYSIDEIEDILFENYKYQNLSNKEQDKILSFWKKWLPKPIVQIKNADEFTDNEEKQFVIKDNINFGEDDLDVLKVNFDIEDVESYAGGIDQLAYDFDDAINDENIEIDPVKLNKLKCGYIESVLSKDEYEWLTNRYNDYSGNLEMFIKEVLLCK